MPDDTTTPELPESAGPDLPHPQAEGSDHAGNQHVGDAQAETKPDVPSNPASSETKDAASNGKVDEFEVPADIQAWPDEKPVISKEDEDRLLKVSRVHLMMSFSTHNSHMSKENAKEQEDRLSVRAGVLPGGEGG